MTIQAGQQLHHYRMIEKIGEGGMGVVWKAEDTRLHRYVALKFVPEESAQDAQSVDRHLREARAASALNHPHICAIHDIGEWKGSRYIVMELLEGQPLQQRIGGKPMDVATAVGLAIEVTDALDAARVFEGSPENTIAEIPAANGLSCPNLIISRRLVQLGAKARRAYIPAATYEPDGSSYGWIRVIDTENFVELDPIYLENRPAYFNGIVFDARDRLLLIDQGMSVVIVSVDDQAVKGQVYAIPGGNYEPEYDARRDRGPAGYELSSGRNQDHPGTTTSRHLDSESLPLLALCTRGTGSKAVVTLTLE